MKKIVRIIIETCSECPNNVESDNPSLREYVCNKSKNKITDSNIMYKGFPEWCPLKTYEDEE